jgi:small subunit ribosomal protein S20
MLANTRSAKKRIRQNEKRRLRNKTIRSRSRTYVKQAREVIQSGEHEAASEAVMQAISQLDRAAQRGVIHPNNAARRKSRLMARLSELAKDTQPAE